jgi:sec-independent protein translocase protein TatB
MNMGSFSEMLFLFFLVLIIFGPKKLPEIARQVGKAMAEFRRASNEFKSQLDAEMRQIEIEEALKKQPVERPPQILPPPDGAVANGVVDGKPASAQAGAPEGQTGVAHTSVPGQNG